MGLDVEGERVRDTAAPAQSKRGWSTHFAAALPAQTTHETRKYSICLLGGYDYHITPPSSIH